MGTTIRPEIGKNQKYYISKNRYYELKHLCLQYKELQEELKLLSPLKSSAVGRDYSTYDISNPTEEIALRSDYMASRLNTINKAVELLDPVIGKYVFKAVIENYSYTYLRTVLNIPCCKDIYYTEYRKFFWILDKLRN